MPSLPIQTEPALRAACFVLVLAAMATWEQLAPRRPRTLARSRRWPGNLGLVLLGALVLRALFPVAAVGVAVLAERAHFGLLRQLPAPDWIRFALAVIALDFAIYLQHVMFHAVPAFWRLHRVHHADLEIDVTTGVRFHPLEIALSMAFKCGLVAALGASPAAVIGFEILLNGTAMFNHANARLSPHIDRRLRWFVVTPDMHRVHHSIVPRETGSNFGFNLPWWDRLLGTYREQPVAGHQGMTIGLPILRDPRQLRLDRMLVQPFLPGGSDPGRGRPAGDA